MGTYTTNKNLYMPTVGEQGWGTLVNGNFETIDNFLKPISLSGSTYTFTGNHVGNQSGGSVSATSITNSGTLTQTGISTFTGKITGNGGIGTTSLTASSTITSTGLITAKGGVKGNLTGNVTGNTTGLLFVKGTVGTSGDENYATLAAQSLSVTATSASSPNTLTIANYSKISLPKRHSWGVYTRANDLSGTTNPTVSTRTVTIKARFIGGGTAKAVVRYKKSTDSTWSTPTSTMVGSTDTTIATFNATVGDVYQFIRDNNYDEYHMPITVSISAGTTYKIKYVTP